MPYSVRLCAYLEIRSDTGIYCVELLVYLLNLIDISILQ